MRILISGGAGFIGSHLARRFARDGHHVIVVDNLFTAPKWNRHVLRGYERVEFIEHDICEKLPADVGDLDAVVNMACPASPVDFGPHPLEILRVCSDGVRNMLELAGKNQCSFLQASTSECYGDPEVHPQPESYWGNVNPIGARSCYDEGKRFAEATVMAYRRLYGVDTRIARIFNTYGPDMRLDDGRVIPNFICQALQGRPLTVYGDGRQTRSLCYVDDLCEGLVRLLESEYYLPVNLGDPQEITILQLAEEIIDITGSTSVTEFKPLPEDDPKVRQPDITTARKVLKWEPGTDRIAGMKSTVEYFRRKLNEGDSDKANG